MGPPMSPKYARAWPRDTSQQRFVFSVRLVVSPELGCPGDSEAADPGETPSPFFFLTPEVWTCGPKLDLTGGLGEETKAAAGLACPEGHGAFPRTASAAISEVTGTASRHKCCPFVSAMQAFFHPLMGDPTNPQDTLFLFVFPLPSQQAD